jgi:hypothetical protein
LRNMLPSDRQIIRKSSMCTPVDFSDLESVASQQSVDTQASMEEADPKARPLKAWTKTELAKRDKLSTTWKEIINGQCPRRAFLAYLGEEMLLNSEPGAQRQDRCCNRCNPAQFQSLAEAPEQALPLGRPRSNTRADVALRLIEEWATEEAELQYQNHPNRRFRMPPCAWMEEECRWQLAHLFDRKRQVWSTVTTDFLYREIPQLRTWEHWESYSENLLRVLNEFEPRVDERYERIRLEKRLARIAKKANRDDQTAIPLASVSTNDRIATTRQRDDSLAKEAAMRCAIRTVVTGGTSTSTPIVPAASVSTPPATRQSRLREYVNSVLSSPRPFDENQSTAPAETPDSVLRAVQLLEQARVIVSDSQSMCSPSRDCSQFDSFSQSPSEVQSLPSVGQRSGRRKRRRSAGSVGEAAIVPCSPVASEGAVSNASAETRLLFTPKTRSGRLRRLTEKGKENFALGEAA